MIQYDWESGTRFGRLMCTGKSYMRTKSDRKVEVICDCGIIKWISLQHLKKGATTSCGCYNRELLKGNKRTVIHDIVHHPIYAIWQGMKQRCYYECAINFDQYGKIGVIISDEWKDNPKAFYDWSLANGWEEGLTIDRYPNKKGNYEPSNCRWATSKQQSRNKTNNREVEAFGETKIIVEWSEDPRCSITQRMLCSRLHRGWDAEAAIITPRGGKYKK